MNGESSVQIDRGRWLYRFALGADNIAIYRCRRSGQDLASVETWRRLAHLGVSDAFLLRVGDGWQPVVELDEGRQSWALETRPTAAEAGLAVRHLLASLADAFASAAPLHSDRASGRRHDRGLEVVAEQPVEPPAVSAALEAARAVRDSAGWELVYGRQRAAH